MGRREQDGTGGRRADSGPRQALEQAPDATDRPATQWYHDHLLDFTGPNVYRGLAGFLLVYDELDTGDENTGLRLPSLFRPDGSLPGFDIPLVFSDRLIAPDGSLVYLPEDFDGFLGDKRLVNGRIDPFLEVERRKYRFRFLQGTNNGGGWWHPIHVHLDSMHVLKRNGKQPIALERDGFARKDTVNLGPTTRSRRSSSSATSRDPSCSTATTSSTRTTS